MTNSRKIHIFSEFKPFLRVITAFNSENFHDRYWRGNLHNITYAFVSAFINLLLFIVNSLAIWYLIEIGDNFKKLFVASPSAMGLLQMQITSITMILKNRKIHATFERLQQLVDHRKFACFLFFFLKLSERLVHCSSI